MNRRLSKRLLVLVAVSVMATVSLVAEVASAAQIGPIITSSSMSVRK
jgi:hypothetical protein